MAVSKKTDTRKVHLERPEEGKRGLSMCGVKTVATRLKDTKKGVTCGNCSKTLTGNSTWFSTMKRKRTIAEKKSMGK